MSGFDTTVHVIYLIAAACFVLGLHLMTSPATARRGNQLSAAGMAAAIAGHRRGAGARPRRHGHAAVVLVLGLVASAAGPER